jgi:colanic acid/amylovoran biosynthesis protein
VTKILIVNLHSSYNAGDAALALVASQQLNEAFPGSTVTLSMNDPASHLFGDPKVGSFMHWFHGITPDHQPKWRLFELFRLGIGSLAAVTTFRWFRRLVFPFLSAEQKTFLKAYFDTDLVASAPGNFLYSSGKFGLSFLTAIYTMVYAIWAQKPLYLLPQSVGPLKHNWERWLIRLVFDRARLILAREDISIEQIHLARVTNPQVFVQPDMAFSFIAAPAEKAAEWLLSSGIDTSSDIPCLGVTAINWGSQTGQHALQERYETALAEAVRYFVDRVQGQVIFFPQVAGNNPSADDRLPARRIIEATKDYGNKVSLIERPPEPAILKAAYGLMDVFIGTRMHSNIFALSSGIPVLAIAYRHKTRGIMRMLKLEEWTIDIDTVHGLILAKRLAVLWENRDAVREQIRLGLSPILAQSRQTGLMVAKDYALYTGKRS